MNTIVLQNKTCKLEFDRSNGALIGLSAVESDWKLLDRPQLGLSFCLLLPLEGRRNNKVLGELQKAASITPAPDKSMLTIVWDGVTSQFGGQHDIVLTATIKLSEQQAVFALTIDNRSPLVVENVYYPYLGA